MKKVLIGISGLLVLAIVVVLFLNAKNAPLEVKKTATEVTTDCGACPSATCSGMAIK